MPINLDQLSAVSGRLLEVHLASAVHLSYRPVAQNMFHLQLTGAHHQVQAAQKMLAAMLQRSNAANCQPDREAQHTGPADLRLDQKQDCAEQQGGTEQHGGAEQEQGSAEQEQQGGRC